MTTDTLLELRDIVKAFSGVRALDGVSMNVARGEIHALVGENGAGKSTLMNVLSGVYPFGTYEGEIIYEGEACRFGSIHESEGKGIVIIHQELALVPYMTIAENMFLGNERGARYRLDWDETYAKAELYMRMVGLHESPRTLIKDIGVGKQQLVEIAKALAKSVRLLILDEPTASLNENDSQKLLGLLTELRAKGVTAILISHKISEVAQVADRITILRDGATIETLDKSRDDIGEGRIIRGMVGREMTNRYPARAPRIGETVFEVENWSVAHPIYDRDVVKDVSFTMRRGEVVGISGLMGAGRTELAMSIFGHSYGKDFRGDVKINGREVRLNSVQDAIDHKLSYLTEDRKGNGLILSCPISFNITLANLKSISNRSRLDRDKERSVAKTYAERLRVKCSGVDQHVANLSGGNQQKVLFSKWMFTDPEILMLDEPTRGVDVGAKYEIYQIINELVSEGKSVLMISSEMPELLGMCDRIYVMGEGRMVGEFARGAANPEAIMACILQASAGA